MSTVARYLKYARSFIVCRAVSKARCPLMGHTVAEGFFCSNKGCVSWSGGIWLAVGGLQMWLWQLKAHSGLGPPL